MSEPKQPPVSCPHFDEALRQIREARRVLGKRRHYESVEEFADEVERQMWDVEDHIEKARSVNVELRAWGEWYSDRYVPEEAVDE